MNNVTTGAAFKMAITKVEAEMNACRIELARNPSSLPEGYNPLRETRKHLIEAVDALMHAAGSIGGIDSKREVLVEAAIRHGIELN